MVFSTTFGTGRAQMRRLALLALLACQFAGRSYAYAFRLTYIGVLFDGNGLGDEARHMVLGLNALKVPLTTLSASISKPANLSRAERATLEALAGPPARPSVTTIHERAQPTQLAPAIEAPALTRTHVDAAYT